MVTAARLQSARQHWAMLIGGVLILAVGIWGGVNGLRADLGAGVKGSFIAQTVDCGSRGGCSWHGRFERPDGTVLDSDTIYQGSVDGMVPGTVVAAIYESTDGNTYPPHSLGWLLDLVLIAFGLGALYVWFAGNGYTKRRSKAGPRLA